VLPGLASDALLIAALPIESSTARVRLGRPALPAAATTRVRVAAEGRGIRETARLTGVSPTKVLGIRREIEAEQGAVPAA
jgi:hypothetical protein